MRIVHTVVLSPWDPRHGGGQLSAHDLSSALARRGHDVTVVFSGDPPDALPPGLPYSPRFVPHHERLYLNPPEFAREARRVTGADVVHSHGYEGAFLSLVARGSTRTVATTRHPDPVDLRDPPGPGSPVARAAWTRRHVIALLERRALRRADAVMCVSDHSRRVLLERGWLSGDERVRVVHNGGRPPVPGEAPSDPADLVCVARLDHHKGLDVLLGALARMEYPATLDLAGAGPDESALRAEAQRLGVADRVRFVGYVEPGRVAALQAAATAVVLPSRSENFPRVVLDALHQGRPLVTTRVGGIPEAVRDGVEALVVPPDDADALADALDRVLGDEALRDRLAAGALERAALFTWDEAARKTEALYEEIIRG